MTYKLEYDSDKQIWDDFVADSIQGNIFCTTKFLDSCGFNSQKIFVLKGQQILLGAILMNNDLELINPPIRYQGLLFPSHFSVLPNYQKAKKGLDIVDFLLTELSSRYEKIKFSLHYNFEDLRSFQWFNYHEPKLGQYKIKLRYTGILELDNINDKEELLMNVRTDRRQDYRKALKNGFTHDNSIDVEILSYLQNLTYKRQGISVSKQEDILFSKLVDDSIRKGFGNLMVCKNKMGTPVSAALFIQDNKCGYYLFGANDPKYRKSGTGSSVVFEQIMRCKEQGLKTVDFCGINSPNRGDFKTSFNLKPMPFFEVTWK